VSRNESAPLLAVVAAFAGRREESEAKLVHKMEAVPRLAP
jgi:hypothetical protein